MAENEVPLQFNRSALNQPILRKYSKAKGDTDEPMPRSTFINIFGNSLKNTGYLCATSIHAIRRQLGKKVDERYTEVQRSQHLTQGDPRIFGQSYVTNTSSVDGQAAFLGERADHSYIDYFQGLEKFCEPDLPCRLPASVEHQVNRDSRLLELEHEAQEHPPADSEAARRVKRQRVVSYHKTLMCLALRQYQESWV
jgi:Protein of unknown function (DUF3435)